MVLEKSCLNGMVVIPILLIKMLPNLTMVQGNNLLNNVHEPCKQLTVQYSQSVSRILITIMNNLGINAGPILNKIDLIVVCVEVC